METIKNKRAKSYAWLSIAIGILIIGVVLWLVYFSGRTYSSNAKAYVDGRIETEDDMVTILTNKVNTSNPIDVIEDNDNDNARIGFVFVGLMEEDIDNETILDLIKDNEIKATFAISVEEALENEEFVSNLLNNNIELISNGIDGEGNLQNKEIKSIVKSLYKSNETLSTLTNINIKLAYLNNTKLTSNILRTASVSGYDALITNKDSNYIDEDTFGTQEEVNQYFNNLSGDQIVVINLRGESLDIENEPIVEAEKPAIDKQPDLDDTNVEEEDKDSLILNEVELILNEVVNLDLNTEYVSNFEKTSGNEYLKTLINESNNLGVVYRYCLTDTKQVGLALSNLPEEGLDDFLSLLRKNNLKITFFVNENDLVNRGDEINKVVDEGHTIGTTNTTNSLNNLNKEDVYDKLYTNTKYANELNLTNIYLLQDYDAKENVRLSAPLLNLNVVAPTNPEEPFAGALYIFDKLDSEILSDLISSIKNNNLTLTDYKTLLDNSGTLSTLSVSEVNSLKKANNRQLEEIQNIAYTTDRAVNLAFYDISNETVVNDIADRLASYNGNGTFFVTLNELMNKQTLIESIISKGHSIGIWYNVTSDYPQTFSSVVNYIHSWQTYAAWRYDTSSNIVFMLSDDPNEQTKEAISASNCKLIKNTYLIVRSENKDITLEQIDDAMESIENLRVMRGSFICFNMGYYTNDKTAQEGNTILGNVLDRFIEEHIDTLAYISYKTNEIEDESRFKLVTADSLLSSNNTYTFNSSTQTDITLNKNVLVNMNSDDERFNYIDEHYYGSKFINSSISLPGFTSKEISKLDTSGVFTNDKVLFLTFDDWGTEQSLNELLYVLDKYDIKATFFVRTEYVDSNPNLLRTIANAGHQIASHTDTHFALSNVASDGVTASSLSDEEAEELREDIVTSYNKLYKYVGDVVVDGKKSLSRMFRPPTLAVSKIGISQVFDVGYTYSISGEISTGDYEATSFNNMVTRLNQGSDGYGGLIYTHNGTILVMHMQESAKYTAQALDYMIPEWISEGYSFARIDDYLSE